MTPVRSIQSTLPICDDVLMYTFKFLSYKEIQDLTSVCKHLHSLRERYTRYTYFFLCNVKSARYVNIQQQLERLAVNCVSNVQLHVKTLPRYVFIGHYSSIYDSNVFNGMEFKPECTVKYPNTKILFFEEAYVAVDFGKMFPNLEELYILNEQNTCSINLDSLTGCKNLKILIVDSPRFIHMSNKLINLGVRIMSVYGWFNTPVASTGKLTWKRLLKNHKEYTSHARYLARKYHNPTISNINKT